MLDKVILCVFVCALLQRANGQDQPNASLEVDIADQGKAIGFRVANTNVFTFYNIPYATAPSGDNKFKAPLPAPVWSQVYQAVDRDIACPQIPGLLDDHSVVEDCLVANVYVPDTHQTNLPVVVIVHGGAFSMGCGTDWEPISLVNDNDIIAVSFNYRLGLHGFLCLGNEDAPGNAGFKDQVALLRWIKKNIAAFGGNPDDVTVSGCSAGGASVDLLMLSKLTDGLMHKAITDSGSNIGPFSVQFDPLQTAKDHAKLLKFDGDLEDLDALTKFYKSLTYDDLMIDHYGYLKDSSVVFSGCVEKDLNQEMFLEEPPIHILRNKTYKKIPMLYGYASLDGGLMYDLINDWQNPMNTKFSDFLPADLEFETEEEKEEVANKVKEFYFETQPVSSATLEPFLKYFTDVIFVQSMLYSAKLQVEAGNNALYLYEYSFTRSDAPVAPGLSGANHCFQTYAVMDEYGNNLPQDYLEMKDTMRKLWRNFIRNGNPTPATSTSLPNWPPTGANRSPHYSLDKDITVGGVPIQERLKFWEALYEAHLRIPRTPTSSSTVLTFSKGLFIYPIVMIFNFIFSIY